MQYGHTACLQNGPPSSWPEGHKWAGDWADVTCSACLAGRELVPTFEISADGKSSTCLRCKRTSTNPNDVEHHYCGHCHVHHDDLWPPARRAWLGLPDPVGQQIVDYLRDHPDSLDPARLLLEAAVLEMARLEMRIGELEKRTRELYD